MSYLYRLGTLVFITAMSCQFSATKAVAFQENHIQAVGSGNTRVEVQADVETLMRDLFAAIENGSSSYDAIRIVSQIGRLGPQAISAVDVLIGLLGKQFSDCDEDLRVCPNNTHYCVKESRTCPVGAEMRKYDYLTPYAFAALQQIGEAALPRLAVALNDEAPDEQSHIRRRLVAGIMGSIGPSAIPFLSDALRTSDHSKLLALEALYTVLSKDSSNGNQLTNLVPHITPFLNEDFETTDQAIYMLGTIGPGAAEAVPRLIQLLSYQRILPDMACRAGERTGYIFQSRVIDALVRIGTPDAIKALEQYKAR